MGGVVGGWFNGQFGVTAVFLFCAAVAFSWLLVSFWMKPPRYVANLLIALEQLSDTDKRLMEAERTFVLLFRCLALQGKKKDTEAQECLQQARASWELAQNPPFTAIPRPRPLLWTQYLELQILFREVTKARE